MYFFYSLITSSLLDLNILLTTLFWNTFGLCLLLGVRGQVTHMYRITWRISFTVFFFSTKENVKMQDYKLNDAFPEFILLLFSSEKKKNCKKWQSTKQRWNKFRII